MINRDEYIHKLHVKLDELNKEIDLLSAKANEVKEDVRKEYAEQIDSLKAKHADGRKKLEELQHSGEHALEDMKTGVELAWTAIGEAIESARSRFK